MQRFFFCFFFTFSQATSHTHTPCNSQFLSVNSKNQAKCFLFFFEIIKIAVTFLTVECCSCLWAVKCILAKIIKIKWRLSPGWSKMVTVLQAMLIFFFFFIKAHDCDHSCFLFCVVNSSRPFWMWESKGVKQACGLALEKCNNISESVRLQVLTAQGLVDVNAVIHLVMIYLSHLLLNQLDYLPQLKIDFEFQRNFQAEWTVMWSLHIPNHVNLIPCWLGVLCDGR